MEAVREAALIAARAGKLQILQCGKKVDLTVSPRGPIRLSLPKSAVPFDYEGINFRLHPKLYRVARGEQGVLSVEPYKSEILPHWRFKTPEIALSSAKRIFALFKQYRAQTDFVGMDMARKFLQMGHTRARRYANHRSGKKYIGPVPRFMAGRSGAHGRRTAPLEPDPEKAESAQIFKEFWKKTEEDKKYAKMKSEWKLLFG